MRPNHGTKPRALHHGAPVPGALRLAEPDPTWPALFLDHEQRIRGALGPAAVLVEHIGSTAVPGLAAKPIVDVLLTVTDLTAEEDYLPALLAAGYVLQRREPGHRLLRTPDGAVNVHVHDDGTTAAADYLLLRNHLRRPTEERDLYERTKRSLLAHGWPDGAAYADSKTEVIERIKARARSASRSGAEQPTSPLLTLFCGSPGAGKTTLARHLEAEGRGVRLCTDEWQAGLGVDARDGDFHERLQRRLHEHTLDLLDHGVDVILEDGLWTAGQRAEKIAGGRAHDARIERHVLDVPSEELHRRVRERNRAASALDVVLTPEGLDRALAVFQPPSSDERALVDWYEVRRA